MEGTALEVNTLTFTTACTAETSERLQSGLYDRVMQELELAKLGALGSTGYPDLRHFRTPEVIAELSQNWSRYVADFKFLDAAFDEEWYWGTAFAKYPGRLPTENSCGEARSDHLGFVDYALKLISKYSGLWTPLLRAAAPSSKLLYAVGGCLRARIHGQHLLGRSLLKWRDYYHLYGHNIAAVIGDGGPMKSMGSGKQLCGTILRARSLSHS